MVSPKFWGVPWSGHRTIWINTSCEFIMNDCITTTKQSTTKPCAYFLGYTVFYWFHVWTISFMISVPCRSRNTTVSRVTYAGHHLAQTQCSFRRLLSPLAACDPSESVCSDVCSLFHPDWLGCSFRHDGFYPRPWMMDSDFHELAECRNRSAVHFGL